MPLKLIYITNDPEIALIAESNGVDKIMVDLETLGKEERQKNMNTVKSNHSVDDIYKLSKVLTKSELMVRINPWNDYSKTEIDQVIAAGAERIMLPMWKCKEEVDAFYKSINGRVSATLLLETKEAVNSLDKVLENPLVDEIHIGLNDLHLSYNMTFMFEPLSNGLVETLCQKCKSKGIKYGFGGIARIGEGTLPAEMIVMEHYRLCSTAVILSRSFCNADKIGDKKTFQKIFSQNVAHLREYENQLKTKTIFDFEENKNTIKYCVDKIVSDIKEGR